MDGGVLTDQRGVYDSMQCHSRTVNDLVDQFGLQKTRSAGRNIVLTDDEEAVNSEAFRKNLICESERTGKKATERETKKQIDHSVDVVDK